jgi:hypothetical protein
LLPTTQYIVLQSVVPANFKPSHHFINNNNVQQ